MLITQPGFIVKVAKINRFLKSKKVAELKRLLEHSRDLTRNTRYKDYSREQERSLQDAEDYLNNFECVEIAFLMNYWESENKDISEHLAYLNARHSEHNMFEVSYLSVSLGNKKHKYADEMGLKDKDIQEYQEIWRKFGVDATKAEFVDEDDDMDEGGETVITLKV